MTDRAEITTFDRVGGLDIKVVKRQGVPIHVQMGGSSGQQENFKLDEARRVMNAFRRAVKFMERETSHD